MEFDRQLADLLGEFARTLATDFPIQSILDHLVVRIVHVLPITAAAITLISSDEGLWGISASDDTARQVAQLQSDIGEGPGLAAYETGKVVVVSHLHTDDRYPAFAARAAASGLMAVFAFPLRHGDTQLGAVEIYQHGAGPLDAGAMMAAQTLADVAAAYVVNAPFAPTAAQSHLAVVRQPSRS